MMLTWNRLRREISMAVLVVSAALLMQPMAMAAPFTFAGFNFEQAITPDRVGALGGGVSLGGANFSAGFTPGQPGNITRSVGFGSIGGTANSGFTPVAGWINGLSLGQQAHAQLGFVQPADGSGSLFSSAVNLPLGDNGSATRNGLTTYWSSGQGLINGAGNDFVIYESGTTSTGTEAFMVRLGLGGGLFTPWYFESQETFQNYTISPGTTGEGAFATGFDISSFGLAAGDVIYEIQIANLIQSDRIVGAPGTFATSGFVVFGGIGAFPSVGSVSGLNPNGTYAAGALDPDPLYVGILGQLTPLAAGTEVPEPASLAVWGLVSMVGVAYGWRKRRRVLAGNS